MIQDRLAMASGKFGEELLEALGLNANNPHRCITAVTIHVRAKEVVLVRVTEELRESTGEKVTKVISRYNLVPQEPSE